MNAISFRQNEKENKIPHLRHRFGTVEKKQCIRTIIDDIFEFPCPCSRIMFNSLLNLIFK